MYTMTDAMEYMATHDCTLSFQTDVDEGVRRVTVVEGQLYSVQEISLRQLSLLRSEAAKALLETTIIDAVRRLATCATPRTMGDPTNG